MTNALRLLAPNAPNQTTRPDAAGLQCQVFQATRTVPRPVRGLMPWLMDRRNLTAAWDKVSAADGADTPGLDGVTCGQLKARVGPWLADLADDLFHRRYAPGAVRWVDIPKANKPGDTESR